MPMPNKNEGGVIKDDSGGDADQKQQGLPAADRDVQIERNRADDQGCHDCRHGVSTSHVTPPRRRFSRLKMKKPGKFEAFRALELLFGSFEVCQPFTIRSHTAPPSEAVAPRRQQHAQAVAITMFVLSHARHAAVNPATPSARDPTGPYAASGSGRAIGAWRRR
jgi:hypothetical protein